MMSIKYRALLVCNMYKFTFGGVERHCNLLLLCVMIVGLTWVSILQLKDN